MDRRIENHLLKYPRLGHTDISKYEWLLNQHRDSLSSYIGRFDMLNHIAIAENESKGRVNFNLIKSMIQPCGPPPHNKSDFKN